MQCKFRRRCNSHCPDCIEDGCARLEPSPFVRNGCGDGNRRTLRRRLHRGDLATEDCREPLVESRRGVSVTEAELPRFDELPCRLTKNGQSVHAAAVSNPGLFTVSEKTPCRHIDGGLLPTKNGDHPRKRSPKPRRGRGAEHGVDPRCRTGRTWDGFRKFTAGHPGLPLTEMDTAEGTKGGGR